MAGVLDGFRVLEFGGYTATQVLGMLLCDQGADVVKVEPPAGERMRGEAAFAVWNRGKKSVVTDFASEDGAVVLQRLAATADVLISDSDDIGGATSVERLLENNPRLVGITLPAFSAEHPDAGLPPLEPLIAAASGVYADRGSGAPSLIAVPHASVFGAITAAAAVAAK